MIIKRSIEHDGNIMPEVYNLLNNLPKEVLHHTSYGYAHPLGIYNKSLTQVFNGFLGVLIELEVLQEEIKHMKVYPKDVRFNSTKLLKSQKELLYSLRSHIDICYHILKATTPNCDMGKFNKNQRNSMERSAYKWLELNNFNVLSYFQKNIRDYKYFLDPIVNKLKHEHAKLRDIIYIDDFERRIGYFIEGSGVDERGEVFIGPDSEIHPNDLVFSYSRDLSFHFYNIYKISHYLKNSLIKSFKEQYNLTWTKDYFLKEDPSKINDIVEKIDRLNSRFFPKEFLLPLPIIEWDQDANTLFLLLDKEFRLNSDLSGSIRKIVDWTPDSTTKNFRFPIG